MARVEDRSVDIHRQAARAVKELQRSQDAPKDDALNASGTALSSLWGQLRHYDAVAKLTLAFKAIDVNNDGVVTREELRRHMENILASVRNAKEKDEFVDLIFKKYAVLDPARQELIVPLKELMDGEFRGVLSGSFLESQQLLDDAMTLAFQESDLNKDGFIDSYELIVVLQKLFPDLTDSQRKSFYSEILRDCDTDSDGKVSLKEFLANKYSAILSARSDFLRGLDVKTTHVVAEASPLREQRCREHSPTLKDPIDVNEGDSEGHALYVRAEEELTRNQVGISWDDGVSLFDRAASLLKRDGHFLLAGNAYMRCADCKRYLHDIDGEAQYYLCASSVFRHANAQESVKALKAATAIYQSEGRRAKSARCTKQIADVLVEDGDFQGGVSMYRAAATEYSAKLGMKGEARACLSKAVEVAMENLGDLALSSELLEQISEVVLPVEQPLIFFRAMLCHLASVPPEHNSNFLRAMDEVGGNLAEYMDVCPDLVLCTERALLLQLMEATKRSDPDSVDEDIGRYVAGHTLEPWVLTLLRVIHQNASKRKSTTEKFFSFTGSNGTAIADVANVGPSFSGPMAL